MGTQGSNLDEDVEALTLQTTSRRRCRRITRYHMEDSLLLSKGDEVVLCVAKSSISDPSRLWNKFFPLNAIAVMQQSETF